MSTTGDAVPSINTRVEKRRHLCFSCTDAGADKAKVRPSEIELFGTIIKYEFSSKNTLTLTIDGVEVEIGEKYKATWNEGLLIPNISIYKTVEPSSRSDPFLYRIDFLHEKLLDFIHEKTCSTAERCEELLPLSREKFRFVRLMS